MDFFLSSDASICSTKAFPPLRNSDHVVVSVYIDFPSNSPRDAPFHLAYEHSCADWNDLHDHLRDVQVRIQVHRVGSVWIDVYISHLKYQVKPYPSPWFSAACAVAIVHRSHFYVCSNRINLLYLK